MNKPRTVRLGLLGKIILFLAVTLVPLAAITWWISVRALTTNLTDEFTSKGSAIAKSLASSTVDLLLTRDASTVQATVDQFGAISGVKYVIVYDPQKTLVAHTFSPLVPAGIVDRNLVPGEAAQQVREIVYADPVTGAVQQIIDIGVLQGLVEKSGSWYSYGGERIGQGKENARTFLEQHPDIAQEIEGKLREKLLPAKKGAEALKGETA